MFRQFHIWVAGNTSRVALTGLYDTSRRTLVRRFAPLFIRPLTPHQTWSVLPARCVHTTKPWMYGADGKWLHHSGVFLVHRDVTNRENLWWSYTLSESYTSWNTDIHAMTKHINGHLPKGVISDWKRGLRQAVVTSFGLTPHQRCLAHVARFAAALLPKGSPYLATRRLRDIAFALRSIRAVEDMEAWKHALTRWGYLYGDMLTEKTRAPLGSTKKWWYTHGNLRRGWRVLTTDIDAFFVFVTVKGLPKTNNSLEGVNRNIKGKLGVHRGLTVAYQVSLLSWVMVFSRMKKQTDLQTLWDAWRRNA